MIEVTIKLSTEQIEAAVRVAWQQEFLAPTISGRQPEAGWQEVRRQVRAHIETLDLSEVIAREAKARIDDVVNEVVTIALREKAKQRAKEMMRDGTLLQENK